MTDAQAAKAHTAHHPQGGSLYVQFSETLVDKHETIRKWSRHPFDGAIRFDEARVNKGPAADAMAEQASSMLPKNLCLTNSNIPDSMEIPLTTTMGELRALAQALTAYRGEA